MLSALDFASVFLGLVGIVYLGSTLFEAFKYTSFFSLVIFMMLFFKTRFYRHTWAGIGCCFAGILALAASSLFLDSNSDSYWQCSRPRRRLTPDDKKFSLDVSNRPSAAKFLPTLLMLGSGVFTSFQIIYMKKLFDGHDLMALRLCGLTGAFEMLIYAALVFLFLSIFANGSTGRSLGNAQTASSTCFTFCRRATRAGLSRPSTG